MKRRPSHWPADWNGDVELVRLKRILLKRAPEMAALVDDIRTRRLTAWEREALRGVVADEMQAGGGLGEDGGLNSYGDSMDLLIQWLGEVSEWDGTPNTPVD